MQNCRKLIKLSHARLILLSIVLLMGGWSCSSQKNTFMSRNYHNLTSYYNYYYNAYDNYKNGTLRAEKGINYNYTLNLPVLLIGESQVPGIVSGDMERTLNKCTMLLARHSITVKPARKKNTLSPKEKEFMSLNEYVRWARESWLLVGMAHTWKQDLPKARSSFEFVIRQFPGLPIWFEAQVWLARVAILEGDYVDAQDRLKSVESNRKRPRSKKFNHLLSSTWAYYYQKQQQPEAMLPYLMKAIELAPKKNDRIRYTYILAQTLQQIGKNGEALIAYQKVLKLNPAYDMAFSARIQLIALSQKQGGELKRELIKLSKDAKNSDYLDQLYFTLGNLEQKDGNTDKAIEYYTLSARYSKSNSNQKGMSYLVLADYYFSRNDYTRAQAYYDSSYNSLDNTYPEFERIEQKAKYLNSLVENITTIKTEDSLLRVAAMPKEERDALIKAIIANIEVEEQRARAMEQEDRNQSLLYQQSQRFRTENTQGGGKWYFYNQASLSYGQSEFQMKWGKRKLEDNWRRKNKRVLSSDEVTVAGTGATTGQEPQKQLSPKTPEYYLVNLPFSDSLKQLSIEKVKNAMLRVAEIYEVNLSDYNEAKAAYLKLAERFSDQEIAANAYYRLYRMASQYNRQDDAARFRSTLTTNYPKSPYAILLSNPAYFEQLSWQQNEGEEIYQKAYDFYSKGHHTDALSVLQSGMTKVKNTLLEPKFLLLEALCQVKTTELRVFKSSLSNLATTFPRTDEGCLAEAMLKQVEQRELQLISGQTDLDVAPVTPQTETQSFTYTLSEGEHVFVMLVPKRSNINQTKFNIISFNVDEFIEADLNVANQPFTDYIEMITCTGLKDKQTAIKYFTMIRKDAKVFAGLKPTDYQIFVISIDNFARFLSDKSIPDYLNFFKAKYKTE
ncbi:MAG TPA: tetratricopeptide repeat protein [Bacteroidales bacterium]|nr:tetratricopeptide repeat protein [Bacteroidales bacterium]